MKIFEHIKKKSLLGITALALTVFAVALAFYKYKIDNDAHTLSGDVWYWIFVSGGIILLFVIYVITKFKKASIASICAISTAFFGVVCMFIFQPFTVPDEQSHYKAIYHVSNQQLLDFNDVQKGLRMRGDDYKYCSNLSTSLFSQDYIKEQGFDSISCKDSEIVTTDYGYMTNKTIPYFVPAMGISFARVVGIGPYWTFQMGRLFNLIQGIVLVYFAIKIIPFGKGALAAISLLPINLHIRASLSYDAFTYAGVVLLFAYIVKLIYDKKPVDWKQLSLLALMIILVVPQKVVYIGVAALLLIIPKDRFAKPKYHFAFKCALGVIAVVSILVLQMQSAPKLISDTVTNTDVSGYSITYVLTHLPEILNLFFNTLLKYGDFYSSSAIAFFGCFELQAPWFMIIPYFVLLTLAFMRRENEPEPQKAIERIYSALLFVFVFVFIELLLLIDHTAAGRQQIEGVQGRYFIPALPLLIVAARNRTITLKEKFDRQLMLAVNTLNMVTFIYCLSIIIPR